MMRKQFVWLVIIVCLLANYASGVVYVNKASEDPSPDGSSWAKAYRTIQEGIDAAAAQASPGNPVEVWVAQGNYDETRTESWGAPASVEGSLVLKSYVHLYGGFRGNETSRDNRRPSQYVTTIDGRTSRGGTNAYHVVAVGRADSPTNDVIIDGFHIRGGRASGVANDYHSWRGGGLYNWLSSPIIANCVFYDNTAAVAGGAIANMSGTISGTNYKANALIHDCVFRGNSCNESEDTNSNPMRGGAAIFNNGINSSAIDIGNETYIVNCTFYNNVSANLAFPPVYSANTIMNCGCGTGFPKIYNSIFWNPSAPANPHIRSYTTGIMDFTWSADVQYCDVQGTYGGGGSGNIGSDPLFRNPGNNDFRLQVTFPSPVSPCFDAGGDALVQPPLGAGRVDIRNFQRKNGTAVDMGAYENVATPIADFSANPIEILAGGTVQFTDLSNTFGSWTETTWSWNFGDTGTSSTQNPSHQYNTAGKYSVSLTVQTAEGSDNETKTAYIVVHTPPVAQFSASPTSGQHPLTVTFTDESIADQLPGNTTQITDWYWDFDGDGTDDAHYTTATNPQWTYETVDIYTVSLRVVSEYGEDTETKTNYIDVWPDALAVSAISIEEFDIPRSEPFNEDDYSSPTALNLTDGYIGFGRSFKMRVTASGGYGPPYQYQWQINRSGWINLVDGQVLRYVNGSGGPNNTPVTTKISGATTNQLTVEYAIPGYEDGQYRCIVADPNDTPPPPNQVISGAKTITINPNMLRTVEDLPTPVKKYIGENVSYGFKFIGGPGSGYLYQWYVDTGNGLQPIGGGTNPIVIYNLDQSNIGIYYGTAYNMSGGGGQCSFAGPSNLDVKPVVSITQQPQSIHRNTGGTAEFSTTAAGGYQPYTYEWYWNGGTLLSEGAHPSGSGAMVAVNNDGATSTLTITGLGLADAGAYKCTVADTENRGAPSTEDTQEATLNITDPLIVSDPTPSPISRYEGENYSITITASGGTPPYTYDWQRDVGSGYVSLNDGDLEGRVSIVSGAGNSVFQLTSVVVGDTGSYRCVVEDSGPDPDAYPANPGVLNVYTILDVSGEHPSDVSANVGNQAEFTVQTEGGIPPLSYVWQYATDPLGPWTNLANGGHPLHASSIVSGADSDTLSIQLAEGAHLSPLQHTYYRCIVTDSGVPQTGISRAARLQITNFINVSGPNDVRAYVGESPVRLIANVTGGIPPFYYQWFKNDESLSDEPIEGQNTLDRGDADDTDVGNYYVIVSDSSGGLNPPVTSRTAEVKVAEPPQIITHPQSLNVYAGQDAIFEVEVSGGFEPYTYDWWQSGVGSLGVNDSVLLLPGVDATYDGNQYLVYIYDQPSTITGINTTLISDPALLRVASEVVFTQQPQDTSLYIDDPSFWLTADFDGGLSPVYYEWKRDLPGGGTEVVAANTLAIEVNTAVLTVGIYKYYLEVTDDVPMVYQSYKANVEVGEHLALTQDLLPEYNATANEHVEMSIQVSGGLGEKTYTWYRNLGDKTWSVIDGAEGPSLVIDQAEIEDSGQYYVVVQDSGSSVSGRNDTVTSRTAVLTVEKGIPASTNTGIIVLVLISAIAGIVTLVRKRVKIQS